MEFQPYKHTRKRNSRLVLQKQPPLLISRFLSSNLLRIKRTVSHSSAQFIFDFFLKLKIYFLSFSSYSKIRFELVNFWCFQHGYIRLTHSHVLTRSNPSNWPHCLSILFSIHLFLQNIFNRILQHLTYKLKSISVLFLSKFFKINNPPIIEITNYFSSSRSYSLTYSYELIIKKKFNFLFLVFSFFLI